MGRINRANLNKTIYYLKRNGFLNTWYAVRERLEERKQPPYIWIPPSEEELEAQRSGWEKKGFRVTFSILVPAYRTKPEYLKELMDSLYRQTYPKWELILADATEDDSVERVIKSCPNSGGTGAGSEERVSGRCDSRIRYIHLEKNAGIAENTNQALPYATGDYVGLLDHDDILTENALYEVAAAIEEGRQRGIRPLMLYSDEDKCNGDRTEYYEPNFKEDFNLDLLLSNNYICHFLVMDRALIQKLKFRKEYEGAQDFELVLRAAEELGVAAGPGEPGKPGAASGSGEPGNPGAASGLGEPGNPGAASGLGEPGKPGAASGVGATEYPEAASGGLEREKAIVHIPRVLYHWRCHPGSTAENPQSKLYAYEAGRRAVQDFADRAGWRAKAADTAHVGFYRLRYEGSIFDSRTDVGAVGGRLTGRRIVTGRLMDKKLVPGRRDVGAVGSRLMGKRIVSGRLTEEGRALYENLLVRYSGYLHRAALPQDAYAVDIRNIRVRPECRELFRQSTGVSYQALPETDLFDASVLPEDCDILQASLEFGRALRESGYRVLYLPEQTGKVKK